MRTLLQRGGVFALLAALTLAGCSTESQMRAEDPAAPDSPASAEPSVVEMPTAIPAADETVRTRGLATVLDPGTGPQLCLGAVAESLPPQCTGLAMSGWDWAARPEHEAAAGVRWGSFALTGTWDGSTFTVVDATPAALYDAMPEEPEEPLATPCDSVAVVDAALTTPEAMDATLNAAEALPDLAMTWLDGETINVAVTEDVEGAEEKLRETWGGPLCISTAERTGRELTAIQAELNALPGLLSSGSTRPDELGATVVYDDGSLQDWVDEEFGEDLVRISSALVSAEG